MENCGELRRTVENCGELWRTVENWGIYIIGMRRGGGQLVKAGADGRCPAQWPYLELFSLCGAFPEGAGAPGGARASSGAAMEGGAAAGRSPPSRVAGLRKPRKVGAARCWRSRGEEGMGEGVWGTAENCGELWRTVENCGELGDMGVGGAGWASAKSKKM